MLQRLGTELAGYRLIQQIGQGGFSDVYLGEKPGEGQTAIKILKMQLTPEGFRNFINEARMIRMTHPHIVKLVDFNVLPDNTPFLVMEYIQHGNLRQRHPKGSVVPLPLVRSYVRQVAQALQYAHQHQRIAHLDIKPENMLLRTPNHIVLSDFGIASLLDTNQDVPTRDPIGTIPYMSPEQLRGKPGFASDQYSLAIVIYEWLCGTRPFEGAYGHVISQHLTAPPPPLSLHLPNVPIPSAVEQVLLRALAKDPDQRFSSIGEFAAAFDAACGGPAEPIHTGPADMNQVPETMLASSYIPNSGTGIASGSGYGSGTYNPTTFAQQPEPKKGLLSTPFRWAMLVGVVLAVVILGTSVFTLLSPKSVPPPTSTEAPLLKEIRIGLVPSSNPEDKKRNAQAFADALSEQLNRPVSIYVGKSYGDTIEALGRKELDVGWFGTFSYVAANKKYNAHAILRRLGEDGKPFYNSLIISLKLKKLEEVKNKRFAFVDKYSTSGGLYPRYNLTKANINPDTDVEGSYAYQHEEVLRKILKGEVDAGAISSNVYNSKKCEDILKEAGLTRDDIMILHTSEEIPQGPIAVRANLNPKDVEDIKNAFLAIDDPTTLRTIEVPKGFQPTDDSTYDNVRTVANNLNIKLEEGANEK